MSSSSSSSNDALLLFSNAISSPPNSLQQRKTLIQLKSQFDSNPALLPILYPSLLSLISSQSNHPSIKKWVSSIIELAICRPNLNLSSDQRLQIIIQSTETIHKILNSQELELNSDLIESKKFAIQAATSSYPIIFKLINTKSTSDHTRTWSFVNQTKSIILSIFRSTSQTLSLGLKVASIKYIQKLIQVGTKGGSADPRKRSEDPSIAMCSSAGNSFIKPKELEQEANLLLEELIRLLYQTTSPEIASAIIITTGTLVRHRPTLSTMIINTLTSYIPPSSPLAHQNKPTLQIKGVEKTLRITLSHLERHIPTPQIREALVNQMKRLEELNEREKDRKRRRKEEDAMAKKRAKSGNKSIMPSTQSSTTVEHPGRTQSQLQGFDVTSLGLELVVELVIANLLAVDDQTLHEAMTRFRYTPPIPNVIPDSTINSNNLPIPSILPDPITRQPQIPVNVSPPTTRTSTPIPMGSPKEGLIIKWEPEAPMVLDESNRRLLLKITLDRIAMNEDEVGHEGVWSTLLARLVTRGMDGGGGEGGQEVEERREDVRKALFGFVVADFPKRMHFARVWLMEEWLATRKHQADEYPQSTGWTSDTISVGVNAYDRWLGHILEHILTLTATTNHQGERSTRHLLSQFLLDLPHLPERELNRLVDLCEEPEMLTIGFTSLREITSLRPTLRFKTLDLLLGLATHKSRQTRNAAIVSVKSWVGSSGREWKVLGERVVSFAVQLVQRLEEPEDEEDQEDEPTVENEEEGMEDGEVNGNDHGVRCATVQNAVLQSGLGKAKDEETVVRHLELLLALSVKNPDLLDHLFRVYPNVSPHIRDCVQQLITPLIRSLGAKHQKIVSLIENCQAGSESLVLRILSISTEKGGKPPQVIIEAIKHLASTSTSLSPRFIIPMIGELNKEEILFHLPKILTLLNGSLQEKLEVKSVFESIIQLPPNNFGSVSTNAPRINRGNEVLLTPVELLVKLHQTDDSGGKISIKQAIEAIGLCFSMTEIFKPEVLAAFMQQVVDEMTLPTLFLRTVIQAVQTYKSLQPFVSTTLLSRLIIKKIWTIGQLWEGFMRCSKIIAPHSFGALLQLPREQLKELVSKQAVLKAPLREYVVKKAGNNKSRVMGLLEILSDTPTTPTTPTTTPTTITPTITPTVITNHESNNESGMNLEASGSNSEVIENEKREESQKEDEKHGKEDEKSKVPHEVEKMGLKGIGNPMTEEEIENEPKVLKIEVELEKENDELNLMDDSSSHSNQLNSKSLVLSDIG
ncbi:Symplekin tight junction protein C terminal-domain-containing protein [Melampsora americana]|nr:Symplekin tight junction protein C terminal-domain-containing protein [Melampsora americana]